MKKTIKYNDLKALVGEEGAKELFSKISSAMEERQQKLSFAKKALGRRVNRAPDELKLRGAFAWLSGDVTEEQLAKDWKCSVPTAYRYIALAVKLKYSEFEKKLEEYPGMQEDIMKKKQGLFGGLFGSN